MAEWRAKGYVPDSDSEEDEDISFETPTQPSNQNIVPDLIASNHQHLEPEGEARSPKDLENCTENDALATYSERGGQDAEDLSYNDAVGDHRNEFSTSSADNTEKTTISQAQAIPIEKEVVPEPINDDESGYKTPPRSSANFLQSQLETGLKNVAEILNASAETSSLSSLSSSPLSSVRSFGSEPISATSPITGTNPFGTPANPQVPYQENQALLADTLDLEQSTHNRNLRQRNAIQKKPYTLEAAQYQQSLKARGLKPVRILPSEHRQAIHPREAESQHDFLGSQYEPPSPPVQREKQTPKFSSNGPNLSFDDDLPALEDIFQRNISGMSNSSRKRRKLFHAKSLRDSAIRHDTGSTFGSPRDYLNTPIQTGANDMSVAHGDDGGARINESTGSPFDLETPTSRVAYVSEDGFRFPRGLSPGGIFGSDKPVAAPKPVPSSKPAVNTVDVDSSSDEEGDMAVTFDSDDDSPASQGEEESQGLEVFQRKIKGVLPASWLRLDRMKQKRPATQKSEPSATSPGKPDAKGVAQKIRRLKSGLNGHQDRYGILLSDDSSSDDSPPSPRMTSGELRQARLDAMDSFADDVVEDNSIDSMLPASNKPKRASSKNVNRQLLRLSKHNKPPQKRIFRNADRHRQSNLLPHVQQPALPIPRIPRRPSPSVVGILDATDVVTMPRKKQPLFLRVAARQARSRKDNARRKPANKIIRLATEADTREANEALTQWKSGQISQRRIGRSILDTDRGDRFPLQERDVNRHSTHSATGGRDQATSNQKTDEVISRILRSEESEHISSRRPTSVRGGPGLPQKQARRGLNVIRRGRAGFGSVISKLHQSTVREVQVEATAPNVRRSGVVNRFNLSLAALKHTPGRIPARTISESGSHEDFGFQSIPDTPMSNDTPTKRSNQKQLPRPRKPRKSVPRRLNLPVVEAQEPPRTFSNVRQASIRQFIGDLASFQANFDLHIFPEGVRLNEESFVGNGMLRKCLRSTLAFSKDNNYNPRTDITISEGLETVPTLHPSSLLGKIFLPLFSQFETLLPGISSSNAASDLELDCMDKDVTTTVVNLERILQLFSDEQNIPVLSKLVGSISSLILQTATETTTSSLSQQMALRILTRLALISYTGYALCLSHNTDTPLEQASSAYERLLGLYGSAVFQNLDNLQKMLTNVSTSKTRLINASQTPELDGIIALYHMLDTSPLPTRWRQFWDLFNECIDNDLGSSEIPILEDGWRKLFTVSQVLLFDQEGVIKPPSENEARNANWTAVKRLLTSARLLPIPGINTRGTEPPPFYTRVVFHRCLLLTQMLQWGDQETIVDLLYDFFRRRNLKSPEEEHYSYPDFLDKLTEQSTLQANPKDSSFHSMIKLIAITVRQMAIRADKDPSVRRRLKNLLFRLVPNNGHVSSKYEEVEEHSLTPLRNHHDLLTVLYWASPAQYRPRLQRFADLVDYTESHLSACRISLQTLNRLVAFQISTAEPISSLSPLAAELDKMVQAMAKQHRLVAQEVQLQRGGWSDEHVESAAKYNKRQLEHFLLEILEIQTALVKACREDEQAVTLIAKESVTSIASLFSSRSTQCDELFLQVFELAVALVERNVQQLENTGQNVTSTTEPLQASNEDSQEYGDWSHLEEFIEKPPMLALNHVNSNVFASMLRLICDTIGADDSPPSDFIENLLSSWTTIIQALAMHDLHNAGNFISSHHHESWIWMRTTLQKRSFFPLFASQLINKLGSAFYQENRASILESYVKALVEPEAYHVWLPCFTESISKQNEPMLQTSSPHLLQSARPSKIISIVMLNIRASRSSSELNTISRELMAGLLASMKSNYRELDTHQDKEARDDYVAFIHEVLEEMSIFLPEHRKLEPFFNDVALFPQPAASIYVSLRQYSLNLANSSNQKPLITFIYNILERAAVEDSQDLLQEQLVAALDDARSTIIDTENPTNHLQCFLLQSIFPAYVEQIFTEYGRSMISPILSAIQYIYQTALPRITEVSVEDTTCQAPLISITNGYLGSSGNFHSFLESTACLLSSCYITLESSLIISNLESSPRTVDSVCLLIGTLISTLQPISYLRRLGPDVPEESQQILYQVILALRWFNSFFSKIQNNALMSPATWTSAAWPDIETPSDPLLSFTRSELGTTFQSSWSIGSGQRIFVSKRSGSKEVLAARNLEDDLKREIQATGTIEEWTKWTLWAACKNWQNAWMEVDALSMDIRVDSNHELPGRNLPFGMITGDQGWRLFAL